ncbi:cellulose binding domain-containing protein [Glycomyces salinus]|uniref:cellulose binding domain-containing protein n=1 Tax=Glycomyces salinus TaxID=980294 RepID=UPI0018EDDDB1|nr:cellulose binding domain-containing protein [Glycomyces salinus]
MSASFRRRSAAVLAAAVGLLLAPMAASPAGADHPEPDPQRYYVNGLAGLCTFWDVSGEVRFAATHDPEPSAVTVDGDIGMSVIDLPPGESCDPVPYPATQVEYTFEGQGTELGRETRPLEDFEPIDFTFTSETEIDSVTIAICAPRGEDGSTWPERCGEAETLSADYVPPPPHCEYSYTVNQWDGGYHAEITVTSLDLSVTRWSVYINPADGVSVQTAWNVDWSSSGSIISMESLDWNGGLDPGDSTSFGLIGTGQAPDPSVIEVYMGGYTCAEAGTW